MVNHNQYKQHMHGILWHTTEANGPAPFVRRAREFRRIWPPFICRWVMEDDPLVSSSSSSSSNPNNDSGLILDPSHICVHPRQAQKPPNRKKRRTEADKLTDSLSTGDPAAVAVTDPSALRAVRSRSGRASVQPGFLSFNHRDPHSVALQLLLYSNR